MAASWLLALNAAAATAQPLAHSLPLACEPGKDCWVVNYVDAAPGAEARDYSCGAQTYDGHDGTDIAVTGAAMRAGVTVRASAAGMVRAVRDRVPDRKPGEPLPEREECGNGVLIDHGGGWQTQYCHLRLGSVRVRPGERVERGAPLGLAGQSGRAEFPHLHWTIRRGRDALDPFTGSVAGAGCGSAGNSLWDETTASRLAYQPAAIFAAGLAGEPPKAQDAYDDAVAALQAASPALLIWAAIYHVRAGDRIALVVTAPDGAQIARTQRTAERALARFFLYGGRKRPGERWPAGEYRGEVSLERREPDGTSFSVSRTVAQRLD